MKKTSFVRYSSYLLAMAGITFATNALASLIIDINTFSPPPTYEGIASDGTKAYDAAWLNIVSVYVGSHSGGLLKDYLLGNSFLGSCTEATTAQINVLTWYHIPTPIPYPPLPAIELCPHVALPVYTVESNGTTYLYKGGVLQHSWPTNQGWWSN